MSKDLDWGWLRGRAQDEESKKWLLKIREWRDLVLSRNEFSESRQLFSLKLGRHWLWFRECSAFSAIEVYTEIFRDNNHFIAPHFSGENARVVMDIGANQGFYALRIKERSPACRVICVEPNPYVFEILHKNIESDGLENVVMVNQAASSHNGSIALEVIEQIGAIGGRNLHIAERRWLKDESIESVNASTVTLDTLYHQNGIGGVDILKIDVEGMEMDVLEGSSTVLPKVHRIVVERHSRQLRDQIADFLMHRDFALVLEEDPDFERYYGDMYFVNKKQTGR